jgi:hypothetical protein
MPESWSKSIQQPPMEDMMADGAVESGKDFVSGRVNRANSPTEIWALKKADESFGPTLFSARVNASSAAENPDGPVIGIYGAGWAPDGTEGRWLNGKTIGSELGIGVKGEGCVNGGTGVMGVGGSSNSRAAGGIGVHGIGGSELDGSGRIENIGLGVLGMGAVRPPSNNIKRLPHGAGVAGYGGGGSTAADYRGNLRLINKIASTFQGPGILGVGSEKEISFDDDGNTSGPTNPAAGVVGIGGVDLDSLTSPSDQERIGSGIIGLNSRLESALKHEEAHDITGAGVYGYSENGRGGIFATDNIAQIRLVPVESEPPLVPRLPGSPFIVGPIEGNPELPFDGRPGDVFSMSNKAGGATGLWFCMVTSANNQGGGAVWAPIVFGDTVVGTKK